MSEISWGSVSFYVDQIPPSKNQNNWKGLEGKMKTKIKWRGIFQEEMTKLNLPTPIPRRAGTPLIAIVTLRFTTASRHPEIINYKPAIEECLADALRRSEDSAKQGWIDDDRNDQIRLYVGMLEERARDKNDRGMLVELRWMEPEVEEPEPEPTTVESREVGPFFENGNRPVAQLPS